MVIPAEDIDKDMAIAEVAEDEHDQELIERLLGDGHLQISRLSDPESVDQKIEEIEARKKEIENEALVQNIKLKGEAFNRLFLFLAIETALVFIYGFLQAINWPHGFKLEEWSFKLLIVATITQMAVKHLFPSKDDNQPPVNNE
ncbi:MAG: hypothetical protein NTV62_00970 [Candidatus Gribaldobacteria bacterium]|nr:hypothetical protein [Candidatus Gribaldobacteria bacterium]